MFLLQLWRGSSLTRVTCTPVVFKQCLKQASFHHAAASRYKRVCPFIICSGLVISVSVVLVSPFGRLHHLAHYRLHSQVAHFWCTCCCCHRAFDLQCYYFSCVWVGAALTAAASCRVASQVFTLPRSVLEPACSREQPGSSYKAAVDQHVRTEVTWGRGEPAEEESQDAVSRLSLQALLCDPEHRLALEGLFSSLKTLTAKQDMLHTLRWVPLHHLRHGIKDLQQVVIRGTFKDTYIYIDKGPSTKTSFSSLL